MKNKENEYRELFLAEAQEQSEEMSRLFVQLEKNQSDTQAIEKIFRITHTLKGNAMGMGFEEIADLSHIMEDVFGLIKSKQLELTKDVFDVLFRANDKLTDLVKAVTSGDKVMYIGIKTKLGLIVSKSKESAPQIPDKNSIPQEESIAEESTQEEVKLTQDAQKSDPVAFSETIQVPAKKLDDLLNMVSEMAIERDRLQNFILTKIGKNNEFDKFSRATSQLQDFIIRLRMIPVGYLFEKFHRVVRDAAYKENKEVVLEITGTEVEIDRSILKTISDALVHIIRNAVGHGIETPDVRRLNGKNNVGKIKLNASYDRDRVAITIEDDGKGIDLEKIRKKIVEKNLITLSNAQILSDEALIEYIFHAGFSSADEVSAISGRGVGMDVVKKALETIGGTILVETAKNKGSIFSLSLPSSLAMRDVLLVEHENRPYGIPLSFTDSVKAIPTNEIHKVGNLLKINYEKQAIDYIHIHQLFSDLSEQVFTPKFNKSGNVIILGLKKKFLALGVDTILQRAQLIEKPLPIPLDKVKIISGAALMGNGKICPILDIPTLFEHTATQAFSGQ